MAPWRSAQTRDEEGSATIFVIGFAIVLSFYRLKASVLSDEANELKH